MSLLSKASANELRKALLEATVKCSERCLYQAAKWAAELANSLPSIDSSNESFATETESFGHDSDQQTQVPPLVYSANTDPEESKLEAQELSRYLLAKSFFDCREFDRCAAVFLTADIAAHNASSQESRNSKTDTKGKAKQRSSQGSNGASHASHIGDDELPFLSQRSLFLALYAKYMAGEKRKEEESEMILGPADNGSATNKELVALSRMLESWFVRRSARNAEASNQGFLEYLYGIVLAKSKSEEEAKRWLVRSVHRTPFNWGAWLELASLLHNTDDLQRLIPDLPQHLMTVVFHIYASQELYQSTDIVHHSLDELQDYFPTSEFLKTQRALLFYHSKDFEEAEAIFSSLLATSPYRIDSLDNYSNILYVMSNRPKLAYVAQLATAVDKFRPETCCVVGNYYSLKSEHEKAVMYFRRALTLDRSFLSAWTLMGHEYVEMKNTHAAIESYRRAVDVNRKDYRAWYGLGQTYEVLEMNFYALFYFQRAASLRPYDPKMWQAIGQCYDRIERPVESIKAYKRALMVGSYYETQQDSPGQSIIMDPEILYQIALMYEKLDQTDEAHTYMELTVAQEEGGPGTSTTTDDANRNDDTPDAAVTSNAGAGTGVTHTTSRARMWLARWAFSSGQLPRAMELATELCEDGVEVDEAKALIRDLRVRMEAESYT